MWVLDLDQYNEWMTEEDYEVDEGGHKKIHKVGRTGKFCFLWVKICDVRCKLGMPLSYYYPL
jgi:hypothetical protein